MVRPILLCPLLLAGCHADWQVLNGAPDNIAPEPMAGRYEGTMDVEVRAYGGPVRLARQTCSVAFVGTVDPDAPGWFEADARDCDLGKHAGEVDFGFALPEDTPYQSAIGGSLEGLEGHWDGWFHHDDELYVESAGVGYDRGGRAEFLVFVDAARVGGLDD